MDVMDCDPDKGKDLVGLFECPICFEYALPPIFQCSAGHLLCSECRPKLLKCPICRESLFGCIRNLFMEKIAETVYFPCCYSTNGCGKRVQYGERAKHEEVCEYRPCVCPYAGTKCKWNGSVDNVIKHLLTAHGRIVVDGKNIVFETTDINLPETVDDWVMIQACFGQNFVVMLKKQDQQFYAIVQLIGSREQSEKYAYRLELVGSRRRLVWEATPKSIHERISTAIQNTDCLTFNAATSLLFAENGKLKINVTMYVLSE